MSEFLSFLRAGVERGGFETDDVLAAVLPLLRQVAALHEAGLVAPLRGLDHVSVDDAGRLVLDSGAAAPARRNRTRLAQVQAPMSGAVEIVTEARYTTDVDAGGVAVTTLDIGQAGVAVVKPVFLPGYATWEHEVGHHDEVTDIFSAGLLLASLACGLDLTDAGDLERFVGHRRNLFALNARLNPVLATVIVLMTEPDRHRRAQDLRAVIGRLEQYRDQPTDLDLGRLAGFAQSTLAGKRQLIQSHLRDRLFDISRRNRLVYFRPTLQTLNLTLASVPLVLDYRSIRLEHLFVWHPALAAQISAGEPLALGRYLRFDDAPYAPGALDRIISEARRDRAEFGFAQLRLVLVFLRWHNLKDTPAERIHSPLLLLPVELTRKRGIRDSYVLTPTTGEAEVNPALRHHLEQVYDLDLPESVDLRESTLDEFYEGLRRRIQASEPAVVLRRIDRPHIELIHERARQRLDRYRRRTGMTAPPPRAAGPIDYSYHRETFHPRGLQLFLQHVKPSPAPLREVAGGAPAARVPRAVAGAEAAPPVMERERSMYSVHDGEGQEGGNPYAWDFDLCAITLGNFNYRRMTLVRDYASLLERDDASRPFDRIFALDGARPEDTPVAVLPLAEQFPVIPCDATQALALARARGGDSYIIQGPPGTGKSQTITNLIADYVARGKRVLFVCEKRAAIDVVFHRLRQQGLDELCCLIHDSQTDKKEFILDLKHTYEAWLADAAPENEPERGRAAALAHVEQELAALRRFSEAMRHAPPEAGLPLRDLVHRLVELRGSATAAAPAGADREDLPEYALWRAHGDLAHRLADTLADVGEDPCFARHALRWVSDAVLRSDRPLETLAHGLERAERLLDDIEEACRELGVPADERDTLADVQQLVRLAARVAPLAERNLLLLLNPDSAVSKALGALAAEHGERSRGVAAAREKTRFWKDPLPAADVEPALAEARRLRTVTLAVLLPAWWRLRRVLNTRYDFARHAVRPQWVTVLEELAAVHAADAALEAVRHRTRTAFGAQDPAVFLGEVAELRAAVTQGCRAVQWLGARLRAEADTRPLVRVLAAMAPRVDELGQEAAALLRGGEEQSLAALGEVVRDLREASPVLGELLPILTELSEVPDTFARALRSHQGAPAGLEAAMAQRCLRLRYRSDRQLGRFDGRLLARHMARLAEHHRAWLEHNGACIRAAVRRTFREHVSIAAQPASQLTAGAKAFKRAYTAGRRDLEHEFAKTMRYKSIRELAAGATGDVIRDLKPIWLMSPLSLSDTLPMAADLFDVVVFDEASQIPLEEAVPALFRAPQVIVVGDEMQLPPTQFFAAGREGGESELAVEEDGERIEVSLDADSFLRQCAASLPSTLLAWHYRSRSEALITFSNAAFYRGSLATIPDRRLAAADLPEIRANESAAAAANVDALLARSISVHFLEHGVYAQRRNPAEAAYIAETVRELLRRDTGLTIGIVAFSQAQQAEIEEALDRLGEADRDFAARLEAELTREEDDQFCGLFVKNLENVQGDERDVILMSVCYGHDAGRRMLMNFGPINQQGGEKRLNVIFSRARHHMAIVSSIRHEDITNEYNDGANTLRSFLRYAEAVSRGDARAARSVLEGLNPLARVRLAPPPSKDAVVEQLAAALRARGYAVDVGVGQSKFRCDLAVRRDEDRAYQLAVLVDSRAHYANDDLVERYLTQPSVLRAFGWRVTVVLTKDWHAEPLAVVDRLERLLRGAGEMEAEPPPADDDTEAEPALPAAAPRRFEFVGGGSRKFWEITVADTTLTVRFGRLGAAGQTQSKSFPTEARCRQEADKLVAEKLRKGYLAT